MKLRGRLSAFYSVLEFSGRRLHFTDLRTEINFAGFILPVSAGLRKILA